MGNRQGFLSPPSGLFPAPLPPSLEGDEKNTAAPAAGGGVGGSKKSNKALVQRRRSIVGRFRFLGRLSARCLMDGQVKQAGSYVPLFFVTGHTIVSVVLGS